MFRYLRQLLFLAAFIFTQTAAAYTVFTLNANQFKANAPTEVFVIGYAGEVGNQFVATAVTRGLKHLDRAPNRQLLFIYANDNGATRDLQRVRALPGAVVLLSNSQDLTMARTVAELAKLSSITSLHFVGHSSATNGFGLQKTQRFTADRNTLLPLKSKFAPEAYVYLHGCNTGFQSAPALSTIWELPVLGSMTSTDFQQLHQDGQWYWNNRGQYPASGGWKRSNDQSFNQTRSCQALACHRLKPNNHPYVGGWGKYETGLPFYKAFCSFDTRTSSARARCERGLWNSIQAWPSVESFTSGRPSFETYKTVVKDFLCPRLSSHPTVDRTCRAVLDEAELTGRVSTTKFFWGNQPACTLQSCQISTTTGPSRLGGRTTLFTSRDSQNQALIEEYKMYLDLFRLAQ